MFQFDFAERLGLFQLFQPPSGGCDRVRETIETCRDIAAKHGARISSYTAPISGAVIAEESNMVVTEADVLREERKWFWQNCCPRPVWRASREALVGCHQS